MRSTAIVLVLPLALLAGCDSCTQKSNPTTSTTGSAAPSASAPTPPAASSAPVAPSGKMAHCPNAVPNAKTSIADVPGGVEMTVTGGDPNAVGDIKARLQSLVDAQKNQGPNIKHTGTGEGGGLLGRCPIVLKDTDLTVAALENGSKITIKAKDPQEVDWLRRETRDREEDLEAAGSPAGAGKMSHCPSAVEGATTTVKNTKEGVSVVVVGSSDDATKAIRDRAKHLVEISKTPDAGAAVATHTGEGGGGGGIGRCPVVLKDTSLVSKDVAGGAQIDVKAKTAADVTKLQEESKERAAKFQLPSGGASGAPSGAAAPSGSAPAAPRKPVY